MGGWRERKEPRNGHRGRRVGQKEEERKGKGYGSMGKWDERVGGCFST